MGKPMTNRSPEAKFDYAWVKARNERQQSLTNGSHRVHSDTKPFLYAWAVLRIALLHASEQTTAAYIKFRDSYALPDCEYALNNFKDFWIDLRGDVNKFTEFANEMIQDEYKGDAKQLTCKAGADWQTFFNNATEFFKVAFNRQVDQDNQAWAILPNDKSGVLFNAAMIFALAEHLEIDTADWDKYRPVKRNGKVIDTEDIMQNKPTNRIHRELTGFLKDVFGENSLIHDDLLLERADQWYKCRVSPGSIEAYLNEVAKTTEKDLDQGRVSNDLIPYDQAVGYLRQRHK